MYQSCLFCHGDLGRNTVLATCPVGSRLAFDPARGRLWVICPACHRWNLVPPDERWEAIEDCERRFRGTRLRFSTANIGLAFLTDGLALVRIGPALQPEIAAWRYGGYVRRLLPPAARDPLARLGQAVGARVRELTDQAGRRMLRLRPGYDLPTWLRVHLRGNRVAAIAELDDGRMAVIRSRHLDETELIRPEPESPWQLTFRHDAGFAALSGDAGLRLSARLLAYLNGVGASDADVRYAVAKLEDAGNPDGYFARVLAIAMRTRWGRAPEVPRGTVVPSVAASDAERVALHITKRSFWGRGGIGSEPRTSFPRLPLPDRLALEMAANEDRERRILGGELRLLEAAWREAERIAAIADELPGPLELGYPARLAAS